MGQLPSGKRANAPASRPSRSSRTMLLVSAVALYTVWQLLVFLRRRPMHAMHLESLAPQSGWQSTLRLHLRLGYDTPRFRGHEVRGLEFPVAGSDSANVPQYRFQPRIHSLRTSNAQTGHVADGATSSLVNAPAPARHGTSWSRDGDLNEKSSGETSSLARAMAPAPPDDPRSKDYEAHDAVWSSGHGQAASLIAHDAPQSKEEVRNHASAKANPPHKIPPSRDASRFDSVLKDGATSSLARAMATGRSDGPRTSEQQQHASERAAPQHETERQQANVQAPRIAEPRPFRRPSSLGGPPYLVTVFGVDDADELPKMDHFLHHYMGDLRVPPEKCLFVLHSNENHIDRIQAGNATLSAWGVTPKRILTNEVFDVRSMAVLIRDLLDEAGVTHAFQWALRADSDEFLDLPPNPNWASLLGRQKRPRNCNHFKLTLLDRVPESGKLAPLQTRAAAGPMSDQFPRKCRLTSMVADAIDTKRPFHNGRMRLTPGGHRIDADHSRAEPIECEPEAGGIATSSHYKWVSSVHDRLARRVEQYKAKGYRWYRESSRLLEHLEKHDGVDVSEEAGLCGPPGGEAPEMVGAPPQPISSPFV